MGSLAGARSLLMLMLRRRPPAGLFHPPRASFSSAALGPRPPAPARFPSLGAPPGPATPWSHGQIRGKARGNEYQPSNLKRKHKHGWIARIRTASGIRVILRRMLKGRKSLTH